MRCKGVRRVEDGNQLGRGSDKREVLEQKVREALRTTAKAASRCGHEKCWKG